MTVNVSNMVIPVPLMSDQYSKGKKVKISLLQAVEALKVARGQGSHIT
jgi:hypothetical protein